MANKHNSIFYNKRLFLFPTGLSLVILGMTLIFPDRITPHMVVAMYWCFGTLLLYILTRILRSNIRHLDLINQDLSTQKLYLENLIEGAPEAIVWGDSKQRIKYVNKKFVEMFGYSQKEVLGKNIDELLSDSSRLEEAKEVTRAVSTGRTQQFEGIRRKKDGTPIHVSIVGAPVLNQDGNPEVFGLYRDTTEEWKRELQLVESERLSKALASQLADANNFKELLLDIITHDLRNPASVLSGSIELLESESGPSEVLDLMSNSVVSLHETIETASTLSKLSVGEEITLEEMDIIPILNDVAESFSSQIQMAEMTLEMDLAPELRVRTNRIIGEVLSNYISNGIKYASKGRKLVLQAGVVDDHPQFSLSDSGETIPEDMREEIFNRRVQLLDGPKSGSGLGLAIVKRIAQANHGKVGVLPNEPQGNTFYFRFDPKRAG